MERLKDFLPSSSDRPTVDKLKTYWQKWRARIIAGLTVASLAFLGSSSLAEGEGVNWNLLLKEAGFALDGACVLPISLLSQEGRSEVSGFDVLVQGGLGSAPLVTLATDCWGGAFGVSGEANPRLTVFHRQDPPHHLGPDGERFNQLDSQTGQLLWQPSLGDFDALVAVPGQQPPLDSCTIEASAADGSQVAVDIAPK